MENFNNFTSYSNNSDDYFTIFSFSNNQTRISFNETQYDILRLVSRILSGFSITGLVFVQIVFWFFRSLRTFALELVALLCFSNILFNITVYFPTNKTDTILNYNAGNLSASCAIQSFINIMFDLSSMLWTTIIGYTAYISVANQEHLENNKNRYRICFILISWVFPLAFALIVQFTESYGPSGAFCWIATEANSAVTHTLTIIYYTLTWLIIILNSFFVVKVIMILKRELQNEQALIDKYTSKLRMYPIVQIISFIPCTINRIYNLTTGDDNFTLMLIQIIFDSLTGLMFSFVYGLNSSVKRAVSDCLWRSGKKQGEGDSEMTDSGRIETSSSNARLSKALSFIDDSITITE